MAKKSIEDVLNEIEDFLNSCKTSALSSNKIVVPRDQFDELFDDLKVKIPAEIDRCKKIMRNKEAILMDARKNADGIIAQASAQANQMISETEVMNLANQKAYETVEMARVEANNILAKACAEANEIRLGSMQYTNDIMMGIRNYVEATMEAERANYENLITTLNNEYMIANANLEEVQRQIVEFTGNPDSIQHAPQLKTASNGKSVPVAPKTKNSMMQKVKQAVGVKEEKAEEPKASVNIPDFIASGEKVVPNETPLEPKKPAQASAVQTTTKEPVIATNQTVVNQTTNMVSDANVNDENKTVEQPNGESPKVIKKKIVKKRNPVIQTPQTAQETVARTLEAAAAVKVDKTVYKANGEQAREIPPMEGRVKRGPRVGRGMVDETIQVEGAFEVTTQPIDSVNVTEPGKSLGIVDDYTMEKKF